MQIYSNTNNRPLSFGLGVPGTGFTGFFFSPAEHTRDKDSISKVNFHITNTFKHVFLTYMVLHPKNYFIQ